MSSAMLRINQVDYIAYLYGDSIKKKVKEITFQITSGCNLCCSYCYEQHKKVERMSLETGKKIIDFIFEEYQKNDPTHFINQDIRSLIFTFVGGEPFLETKLMDGILEYFLTRCAREKCDLIKGFQIGITSNGTLYFNPEVQKFLEKYKQFLSVTISLDGVKELHDKNRTYTNGKGSFDQALKAFEANKKYGKQHTKMTFVPSSFPYIYDSIIFMLKNDVEYIACNYAYEPKYTQEDAKELYYQLKKTADYLIDNKLDTFITILDSSIGRTFDSSDPDYNQNYCGGTGKMLCFTPSGDAYPCIRFAPISIGDKAEPMKIGNYLGIYNTEKTKKLENELNSVTRISQSPQKCIDCKVATGCGWCSAFNYESTGSFNQRVTNICWVHRARVLATSYYYNKRNLTLKDVAPFKINLEKEIAFDIIEPEEWEELKHLEEQALGYE